MLVFSWFSFLSLVISALRTGLMAINFVWLMCVYGDGNKVSFDERHAIVIKKHNFFPFFIFIVSWLYLAMPGSLNGV